MVHPYPIDDNHFKPSAEQKAERLLERWWRDNRLSFSGKVHLYYWLIIPFWVLVFIAAEKWLGYAMFILLMFWWLRKRKRGKTPYPDLGDMPVLLQLSNQVDRLKTQAKIAKISLLGLFPASFLGVYAEINGWIWTKNNLKEVFVTALIYTVIYGVVIYFFGVGFTDEEIKRGESILEEAGWTKEDIVQHVQ